MPDAFCNPIYCIKNIRIFDYGRWVFITRFSTAEVTHQRHDKFWRRRNRRNAGPPSRGSQAAGMKVREGIGRA
jgi:hypothetical protein